jgi:hypothetical protein
MPSARRLPWPRSVRSASGSSHLHETCTGPERSCTGSGRDRADDLVVHVEREPSPGFWTGGRRRRRPTLEDRLIARMLARWLDEELARGMGASLSEAHAARAQQLTGERARRKVARTLERLVDRAQNPRTANLSPLPAPCPEQVRDATPLILSIRCRLLAGQPLGAQGVARLKTLLRDRSGACYTASGEGGLTVALQEVAELLGAETITSTD